MTGAHDFVFLNEAGSLDPDAGMGGWNDPRRSKLWRYHLHYFDDLNASGAAERLGWHAGLIANWLRHNPPGRGTGWEPYPTARRMVNWIKAAQAGFLLSAEALHSLAIQARWLSRRLEHHLSANHLLADAKALCFAGLFFEGPEADAWYKRGSRILQRELPQQILQDGGHYELSPMYHALVLEDLLDLINLHRRFERSSPLLPILDDAIAPMLRWLRNLSHPDGEIAFFNDAALGMAQAPESLARYAEQLGFPRQDPPGDGLCHLAASGYLRVANARLLLLIDSAEIGPHHQPGHAHADTLSFELSLDGSRVLVNGGTSLYGTGPERQRQRGTTAHNTLTVDGANSSEVWSGFRVGRRARVRGPVIARSGDEICISAAHDGYRHLVGAPLHERRWQITSGALTIQDVVSGPPRSAEAHYHFAPGISLCGTTGCGLACEDGRPVLRWEVIHGEARIRPDIHHPRFGVSLPAQQLMVTTQDNRASIRFIVYNS